MEQVQERSILEDTSEDKAIILRDTSLLQLIRLVISSGVHLGIKRSGSHLFALNERESCGAMLLEMSYHCLVMSNIITTPLQFL